PARVGKTKACRIAPLALARAAKYRKMTSVLATDDSPSARLALEARALRSLYADRPERGTRAPARPQNGGPACDPRPQPRSGRRAPERGRYPLAGPRTPKPRESPPGARRSAANPRRERDRGFGRSLPTRLRLPDRHRLRSARASGSRRFHA